MRKEVATEISHEEMEGKRKLFLQRRQITQEVFERAKEKLLAYTQTDTYPSLLEGYASSIAKTLTKPGTVWSGKPTWFTPTGFKKPFRFPAR